MASEGSVKWMFERKGCITVNLKLICVLGSCGGGRDKWKRPVLGELAAKYCDEVIVTNEDPWQIIEQVASGTKGKAKKF
jgi:UDP-N-acetylmuramoyl-L-alanyl-D-glutamate--2,6-diaminopimelate ligase